jgi:hypothetical protein
METVGVTLVVGWDKAALAAAGPPRFGKIAGPPLARASLSHPTREARSTEKTMSREKTATGESFEQKLIRLRTRIDLLPPEQRPHLVELADAVSREHRHLEDRKLSSHDA